MARGWESKAVEQQQAESQAPSSLRQRLSTEQIRARHLQQELQLSRARVLQQLEAAENPRHRELLQRALVDLETRLANVEGVTGVP